MIHQLFWKVCLSKNGGFEITDFWEEIHQVYLKLLQFFQFGSVSLSD